MADYAWAALADLDLGGGERVATAADVLAAVSKQAKQITLDIKPGPGAAGESGMAAAVIKARGQMEMGRVGVYVWEGACHEIDGLGTLA